MSKFHDLALTLAMESEEAAPIIATADSARKNMALLALAELLEKSVARILAANRRDLAAAKKAGLSPAMRERLALDKARIADMADGARKVAALADPVGRVLDGSVLPNGVRISRVRIPLGVILMIYESRPNVTVDAACLSLKSGNACILRGGREAIRSNRELGCLIALALK